MNINQLIPKPVNPLQIERLNWFTTPYTANINQLIPKQVNLLPKVLTGLQPHALWISTT